MKYYVEDSLSNFKFWSGAVDRAKLLTVEQLDTIEQILIDIEPEDGWSDTAINDLFWHDFDTVCGWLSYKDEQHLKKGVSNDDVQQVNDWDGDEDIDCYAATNDFMEWWNNMDDFAKMEVYNKHQ